MRAKNKSDVLLVGTDPALESRLRSGLSAANYRVTTAAAAEDVLAKAARQEIDVLVSQVCAEGLSGLELLHELSPIHPKLPVILLANQPSAQTTIEAAKLGAFQLLSKPFDFFELLQTIRRAALSNREALPALTPGEAEFGQTGLIGTSHVMRELYYQIELAAAHPETVLLLGATGTGKELVARAIHHLSSRAKLPFVPINCTAIPDALFESELFGQEKGAFTGADSKHVGLFEQAHRGTLFLDEIGDLHADKQVKLLRFLEEPCIHRLGGQRHILLDIRVVAATHRNLHRAIEAGTFREDLYYRLSALTIRTPTLSERPDDIRDLVRHFLRKLQTHQPGVEVPIRREAIEFLEQQTWPGNVRQLEQSVRRALLLTQGQPILLRHVQQACDPNQEARIERRRAGEESLTDLIERAKKGEVNDLHARVVEQAERSLISRAMQDFKGSQSTLARLLGITPKTLRRKLRHLKILVTRKARGS